MFILYFIIAKLYQDNSFDVESLWRRILSLCKNIFKKMMKKWCRFCEIFIQSIGLNFQHFHQVSPEQIHKL